MEYKGFTITALVPEPQEWELDENGYLDHKLDEWGVDQSEIISYLIYFDGFRQDDLESYSHASVDDVKQAIDRLEVSDGSSRI